MSFDSNKYYLVDAIYRWCQDTGLTPHIVVDLSSSGVVVPERYAESGKMVLNISKKAVKDFQISKDGVDFYANFSQKVERLFVPIYAVMAIYAYENGEGITFDDDDDYDGYDESGETGSGALSVSGSVNDDVMVNKKVPSLTVLK